MNKLGLKKVAGVGVFTGYGRDITFMLMGAVIGAILGAVFGHLLDDPAANLWHAYNESKCDAKVHIKEGKHLRQQALDLDAGGNLDKLVSDRIFDLHRRANQEFKIPADCGNSVAEAHLGLAFCNGWGVQAKDRSVGLAMVREAIKGDASLAEWTEYCLK